MLAAWWLLAAAPAHARGHGLADHYCLGEAGTLVEAMTLPADALDCTDPAISADARFIISSVTVPANIGARKDRVLWQSDPAFFDAMVLRFTYADGSDVKLAIDHKAAAHDWFARARFSVPVPQGTAQLVAIDQIVERPRTKGVIKDARLIDEDAAREEHFIRSVVYGLLCGLLMVPILYDLMFFRLLRSRFLLWHAALAASQLLYVVSNWGLVFEFFPDAPLYARFHLNTIALAASVGFAVLFVRDLLEKGSTPVLLQHLVMALLTLVIVLKAVTVFDLEALRMTAHAFFLYATIAIVFAVFLIVLVALFRGSKAARYLLVALSGVVLSAMVEILSMTGLLVPLFPTDDILFVAMVVLVLGTSAAAGDRFLVLRTERDRARMEAMRLSRLALSDPLTGLANRRAFERLESIGEEHCLLVADIDHFKRVNDEYGHATGDAVLAHLARLMREAFAGVDRVQIFRMGGEEFAIVMPCEGPETLHHLAERLRSHIHNAGGGGAANLPTVTISVGGAIGGLRQIGDVYAEADQALYSAKEAGRNRIAIRDADGTIRLV